MVARGRSVLAGLVEVDETDIACRSKHDPVTGGGGRTHQGKMLIVGAVEVQDGGAGPGRIRLAEVSDYSANSLHSFVAQNLAAGLPPRPTDGPPIPALPASATIPASAARWPAISCGRGCTGSSLTSRSGLWASITACAASISNPISMNSSSASTAVAPGTPRSAPCSASPPATTLHLPNVDLTGSRGISLRARHAACFSSGNGRIE